jgi:tetratricopeptide (TPR) repeat protein
MAKIPLRAYLKGIEGYIDRGEIDQAIAHAKNIIRSYPKQIDAYRLLGKAFLESQRYSEASDILQRVLSVIPDDFVSQIGMSIIREDEGNLDASIWHMERAYEVQPFNPAVQDELRRLYGRRDGVEPPKIRLTRGALVRMYLRGELYPQAIAETRAALADDPQRFDLLVLLARLYNLSNQKFEATEVCSTLISKLPFCLEANQILAEVLPGTSRAEDAKKFQQRIFALDPYSAFISPTSPTSDLVPDQAVMVEQYIWNPSETETQAPDWTRNIGVKWEETEEEALPDWINTLRVETPSAAEPVQSAQLEREEAPAQPAQSNISEELVPDFLKDAGWESSDRPADQIMAEADETDTIVPAEIPQWLQSIAPEEVQGKNTGEAERTNWLETILNEPSSTNQETAAAAAPEKTEPELDIPAMPDWFAQATDQPEEPIQSESSGEAAVFHDWTAGEEATTEKQEAVPDWLNQLGQEDAQPAAADAQLPDWLKQLETESTGESTPETPIPDWADGIDVPQISADIPAGETAEPPISQAQPDELLANDADMEDAMSWLGSLTAPDETSQPEPEISTQPIAEKAPEWNLEDFATIEPMNEVAETAPAEATPSDVVAAEEQIPDWLKDFSQDQETESSQTVAIPEWIDEPAAEVAPTQEPPLAVIGETLQSAESEPAFDLSDTDAAMAWLESLAARQGADEATLITPPEQRLDTPPDWVLKEMETGEPSADIQPVDEILQPEVETSQPAPSEPVAAEIEEPVIPLEIPEFADQATAELAETKLEKAEFVSEEISVEPVIPEGEGIGLPTAEIPEPVILPGETAAPEPVLAETAAPDFSDMDAAMAWLEALAARQGADEATLTTRPEDRLETPPDWVKREMTSENIIEPPIVEEIPLEEPEMSIPDWLTQSIETHAEVQPEAEVVSENSNFEEMGDNSPQQPSFEEILDEFVPEKTQPLKIKTTPLTVEEPPMAEEQNEPGSEIQTEAPASELEAPQPAEEAFDSPFAWLESLESQEQTVETPAEPDLFSASAEEPEAVSPVEEITPVEEFPSSVPDWLQSIGEEESTDAETPAGAWLTEATKPTEPVETQPHEAEELPDWLITEGQGRTPADAATTDASETIPDWLSSIAEEETEPFPSEAEPAVPANEFRNAWAPESGQESSPTPPTTQPQPVSVAQTSFTQLQESLLRGEIDPALTGFNQLIQKGDNLVETIMALRDSLYRFPLDISIWQTLGDAYARNNQLQEALDAYTKAEELLR